MLKKQKKKKQKKKKATVGRICESA